MVGVINGDSILLTKYANRNMSFYALVAGFVEIGETLEKSELKEALWVKREDILGQTDDWSLTNHMMMAFKAGKEICKN